MSNRSKLDEVAERYAGVEFVDVNKFGENVYSSVNLNNLENARLKINAYKAGYEFAKQENKEIEDEKQKARISELEDLLLDIEPSILPTNHRVRRQSLLKGVNKNEKGN